MRDWKQARLGDFIEVAHGYAFKGDYFRDHPPGDLVVTPGNFAIGGGFQDSKPKYYFGPEASGYTLSPGDLVVTMTDLSKAGDTLGYPALIPDDGKKYLHNQRIGKVVCTSALVDKEFLYWLLRTAPYRHEVLGSATGSTVRHTSPTRIRAYEFLLPPLREQKAIAQALCSYERKIELNRRMNETLEAMTQAIFRDWFVDFGPVRRKLAGERDPVAIMGGLTPDPTKAAELAALFPDSLDEAEVPASWSRRPLNEIADFLNGLALQKYPAEQSASFLPVIKIAELRNGLTANTGKASLQLPEKYIVRDGDFIFSWSGSLLARVWTEGTGALNQHLFKVTSADYPQWFYGCWVQHHMPEFRHIAASKATTMGHIQRAHLTAASTVCPPLETLRALSSIMETIWSRQIQTRLEDKTLAETRDYLLPRLMSGAVQVSETSGLTP